MSVGTDSGAKLYSGNTYLTPVDSNGVATGNTTGCYEASLFTYQSQANLVQLTSTKHDSHGQAFGGVNLPAPPVIGLNLWAVDDLIEGASYLGTVVTVDRVAATVTAQDFTNPLKQGWVDLGRRNIDVGSEVITDAAGGVTYLLDTDYAMNYRLGWLFATKAGAMVAGDDFKATFASAAHSVKEIKAGTETQFRVRINFDGKDQVSGEFYELELPLVTLGSNTPLDQLQLTHVDWQFTGTAASVGAKPPLRKEQLVV